jgi:protein O-GlcNAc transferase
MSSTPSNVQMLLQQAVAAYRGRNPTRAAELCRSVLAVEPDQFDALLLSGTIDMDRGAYAAAVRQLQRAAALDDARVDLHRTLARAQFASGSIAGAVASAQRAVELAPGDADAWNVLGLCLENREPAKARACWEKASTLAPRQPEAHFRLGNLLRRNRDFRAAADAYRAALAAQPGHPVVLNNLGLALQELGEFAAAEQAYRDALQQQPSLIEANVNLGELLNLQNRFAEAIAWYTQAVAINPGVAKVWASLAVCQHRVGELAAAHASFERALALSPADPLLLVNMASALLAAQRYPQAVELLQRALVLLPQLPEAQSMLLYAKQQICDWDGFEALFAQQRASLARPDAPVVGPHNLVALPYTPAELLAAARRWVAGQVRPKPTARPVLNVVVGERLRIGYLGSDFRAHPLANLLSEVIERHDRNRFEVSGYSFGPDDGSAQRARFARAFDHFVDVRAETFEQTAQRIRNDGIAILFDTSGYVIYARSQIFALRPAPIQINCIGFPGTLGADYYDYIMTDQFVTPPAQQANFAERFMLLPHCYMPGDGKRAIGVIPTRAQCGLPESGFVFCCFNASYKILPDVFAVWMRLLRETAGSTLWLYETNPIASGNLRREAVRYDVAPERLVFAPRLPLPDHLARHALADLFLDTSPCNAHTTANDALFAGVPLLTIAGDTFASRVSGSHLHAIGLPELITDSLEGYASLALRLSREPALLRGYRERLARNRATHPLFDTGRYMRAFEALLLQAWESHRATLAQ